MLQYKIQNETVQLGEGCEGKLKQPEYILCLILLLNYLHCRLKIIRLLLVDNSLRSLLMFY